jgi:cell division protein FtsX
VDPTALHDRGCEHPSLLAVGEASNRLALAFRLAGVLTVGTVRELRRNLLTSVATVTVVGISVALLGAALLAARQADLVADFAAAVPTDQPGGPPVAQAQRAGLKHEFLRLLTVVQWLFTGLGVTVGAAGVVAVAVKTRMVAWARAGETEVMRLVGASRTFLGSSLVAQWLVVGLLSGVAAVGLLGLALSAVGPLRELVPAPQELSLVGPAALRGVAGPLVAGAVVVCGATAALAGLTFQRKRS